MKTTHILTKPGFKPSRLVTHHVYANLQYEVSRETLGNARRLRASLERRGFKSHIMACYQTTDGASSWCQVVE